ncbi:MAG: MerR family transcriptional regulator [Propionibacteriaceae bacterium]|jgi:MerR family transcriptional regulator/heat shock protein HspR|nr:MerR family transcriptional regulator [Propionibacteriaceae bacterium]
MSGSAQLPDRIDSDAPLFLISTAARLAGMHPQTLRQYDRLGLVTPRRTRGRGRRYSANDIARLRLVQYLSQDEGINLNGVRRIMELQARTADLQNDVERLTEEVRRLKAAPPGSRVFAANTAGGIWLRPTARRIHEILP